MEIDCLANINLLRRDSLTTGQVSLVDLTIRNPLLPVSNELRWQVNS